MSRSSPSWVCKPSTEAWWWSGAHREWVEVSSTDLVESHVSNSWDGPWWGPIYPPENPELQNHMIPRPYQEADYINALAEAGAKLKETESDAISLLVKITELERERDEYRQYWLDEQANRDRWIAVLTEERDKTRAEIAAMREAIREAVIRLTYIARDADTDWDARDEARQALTKLQPFITAGA